MVFDSVAESIGTGLNLISTPFISLFDFIIYDLLTPILVILGFLFFYVLSIGFIWVYYKVFQFIKNSTPTLWAFLINEFTHKKELNDLNK